MEAFTSLPGVMRVLGKGETKSSIEFTDGAARPVVGAPAPEKFGTALVYATGSKDHNVRLRELALSKGLSLSEHFLEKPMDPVKSSVRYRRRSLRSPGFTLDSP